MTAVAHMSLAPLGRFFVYGLAFTGGVFVG